MKVRYILLGMILTAIPALAIDTQTVYTGKRTLVSQSDNMQALGTDKERKVKLYFQEKNGKSKLYLVDADDRKRQRIDLNAPGARHADGSWQGGDHEVQINIAANGDLTGNAYAAPLRYQFSGHLGAKEGRLRMEITAENRVGKIPAGGRLIFDYTLQAGDAKTPPTGTKQQKKTQNNKKQKKTQDNKKTRKDKNCRWKNKPSFNYASGTYDVMRIRVCEK